MIASPLLRVLLIAQALLLIGAVTLVFGHYAWMKIRNRRYGERIVRARQALVRGLDEGMLPDSDAALLQGLPVRLQIDIFADLAPSLTGVQRGRLTWLAGNIGLNRLAERRCSSMLWWRRLQGARLLTQLGGGSAVVPPLFKDRSFEVRAQAAEWAADHAEPEIVELLLDMLTDEKTLCRFTVQDSLLRLGRAAADPIARRLKNERPPLFEALGALKVAAGLSEPELLGPALVLCDDDRAEVRAMAATVVGRLGGERGTSELKELLADPSAEVRAAAARALGRLGHWPAAGSLARLLRDEAWIVRRDASLALRALGNPGLLLLRRFLSDGDRFASDMARMVLDLPDTAVRKAASS